MFQDPSDDLKDKVQLRAGGTGDDVSAEPERQIEQRYTIEREIGRGGMGTVYLGRLKSINKPVAIKRLPQSAASPVAYKRLRREAEAITALNHPGIVQLHDYGIDPDGPYLVQRTCTRAFARSRPSR